MKNKEEKDKQKKVSSEEESESSSSLESDEEESDDSLDQTPNKLKDADGSHLEKMKNKEEKDKQKKVSSEEESELSSSTDSDHEDSDDDWDYLPEKTTIKAKVIDVFKTEDFYILYFTDPKVNQGDFDEDSMMLDSLNKYLYVTFTTRKDALAACKFKHRKESNLSSVEMATAADFDTYSNLLAVYGYHMDNEDQRKALAEFVSGQTKQEVCDVLQEDEPRSAIIVFDPESDVDISAATWQCATMFNKVHLIPAPVFKFTIRVKGLRSGISESSICRYLNNTKRSGGGEVEEVNWINETEVIVTFKEESSFHGVLKKSWHELEGSTLEILPHYPCLSAKFYQRYASLYGNIPQECIEKKAEKTSPEPQVSCPKLEAVDKQFYFSACVRTFERRMQGTIKLGVNRFQFLQKYKETLEKMSNEAFCTTALSSDSIALKLDWPQRLRAALMRQKLGVALKAVTNFLDSFTVVEFSVDESHMYSFQQYIAKKHHKAELKEDEVYFDYGSNRVIMIGTLSSLEKRTVMNKLFKSFYDEVLRQKEKDGLKINKKQDEKKCDKQITSSPKLGDDKEGQRKGATLALSRKSAFDGKDAAKASKDENDFSTEDSDEDDEVGEEEDEGNLHV